MKKKIEGLTTELVEGIIKNTDFELVDVEYVREDNNNYLRVFLDKLGGIRVNDCEFISRKLESELDRLDPIKTSYILEVSSPGLDRPLKKDKDFERNLGETLEISLFEPINKKKDFIGKLLSYSGDSIVIATENGEISLNRKKIALARIAIIF